MTTVTGSGELTILYLVTAAVLGTLFALVLSIRRMMSLEIKETELIEAVKRLDVRDISIEEKILETQDKILSELRSSKPALKSKRR